MIEFIGDENDGGWYTETSALTPESIIYSFGQGDNISWDLELINKFGCKVYAFDPDPKSIDWLSKQKLSENYIFRPEGIANFDGVQRFYHPFKAGKVNSSAMRVNKSYDDLPVKRLRTFMRERGHNHIDILKIDIEGSEYTVLPDILDLNIGQILFETHERFFTGWKGLKSLYGRIKTKLLFHQLKRAGFETVNARSLRDGSNDCDYLLVKKTNKNN